MSAPRDHHVAVSFQPILDLASGTAAGYQSQPAISSSVPSAVADSLPSIFGHDPDGVVTAVAAKTALEAFPTLPVNTYLSIPVGFQVAASRLVRDVITGHGSLRGIVLDIVGFDSSGPMEPIEAALADYRAAGALLAVGGHGAPQPALTSIVRLKPSIIRLGRDWVRGVDRSESKRSAIEVTGQLAGQVDAWILAEGVSSAAELRALVTLGVPLAQGPLIGLAGPAWPPIGEGITGALPVTAAGPDGALRELLQHAYTARNAEVAATIKPETVGFDALVIVDEDHRPTAILEHTGSGTWEEADVLTINIDTALADAVSRAMARPRRTRFTPLVCTDNAGRYVGILRLDRLMSHLIGDELARRGSPQHATGQSSANVQS